MEGDYVLNEIQSFKSKLANLQKGIRELKNNMTFIGNNQREINSKFKSFTEVDELRSFQRDNFAEEMKNVENSNETYTNKIELFMKEKYDLESQIHHDSYSIKDLKRNNYELEKYRKELESKRILQQKELELLRNKAKINQEKKDEAQFSDENTQRKIEICVNKIKENNSKTEEMGIRLKELENSIFLLEEKIKINRKEKDENCNSKQNCGKKVSEISAELEKNQSLSSALEKQISELQLEIADKRSEANYIAVKLNEFLLCLSRLNELNCQLNEELKAAMEKVKNNSDFLSKEEKELRISLGAKEKLGEKFKQIKSNYEIISYCE